MIIQFLCLYSDWQDVSAHRQNAGLTLVHRAHCRREPVLRKRCRDVCAFHQCAQQFNLSRREKHRLALITAQFHQVLKVNQRSQQPLGPPVKLHPLIKEKGFPPRGYNMSRVQPVHYEPPVPSGFCYGSTTRYQSQNDAEQSQMQFKGDLL